MRTEPDLSGDARVTPCAETATAGTARAERNRRWRQENRDALEDYAREVEREGLPLARFRGF